MPVNNHYLMVSLSFKHESIYKFVELNVFICAWRDNCITSLVQSNIAYVKLSKRNAIRREVYNTFAFIKIPFAINSKCPIYIIKSAKNALSTNFNIVARINILSILINLLCFSAISKGYIFAFISYAIFVECNC